MKHIWNKIGLLGLSLLLGFLVIGFVKAADGEVTLSINTASLKEMMNKSHLHTLYLGELGGTSGNLTIVGNTRLRFSNGLIVGHNSSANSLFAVIGGGNINTIADNSNFAAIGGGSGNSVEGEYGVIGGGGDNKVLGQNGVVVGGQSNQAEGGSVVVGGNHNTAVDGGVVLGGQRNSGARASLALGKLAIAEANSFAWNGTAHEKSAYIGATSGTLIGTTNGIDGVNLVVNGAIQVTGDLSSGIKGEIRSVGGCFYGFDGSTWHVLNRGDEVNANCTSLGVSASCKFGNTTLRHGDTATGYAVPNAVHCPSPQKLTCRDGHLFVNSIQADNYYPYCYEIDD